MTLFQIEMELRGLASELRGHEDVDQWIWIEKLADELERERRWLIRRSNRLARMALPFARENQIAGWWFA